MHRLGLKLWNINTDHYRKCARVLYSNGVFDYIELYVVPNKLDTLPFWKELATPYDIHAPHFVHGMNLSDPSNASINQEYCQQTVHFADELNARFIIFHSGVDGNFKETAAQLSRFTDSRTLIENKPYFALPFIAGKYYVGSTPEEIKYIMKSAGCGLCLDIGHAITSANAHNVDIYDHISEFLDLGPSLIHLSELDITSTMDMHLNYGLGNLDFERVFSLLPVEIPITIETAKPCPNDLDAFVADVSFLKNVMTLQC